MSGLELSYVVYVVDFIFTTTGTTFDNIYYLRCRSHYDDNQDNFLTTCSCLSARRAYKIRPVVYVVVFISAPAKYWQAASALRSPSMAADTMPPA